MLSITRKCDVDKTEKVRQHETGDAEPYSYMWYVQFEAIPCLPGGVLFTDVCEVYADGDELGYIIAHFKHVPYKAGKRSMVWRGEMAQFIYENLL